jgi:hypothetical protein
MKKKTTPKDKAAPEELPPPTPVQRRQLTEIYQTFRKHFSKKKKRGTK